LITAKIKEGNVLALPETGIDKGVSCTVLESPHQSVPGLLFKVSLGQIEA